jgi:hypothetical protein
MTIAAAEAVETDLVALRKTRNACRSSIGRGKSYFGTDAVLRRGISSIGYRFICDPGVVFEPNMVAATQRAIDVVRNIEQTIEV